MKYFWRREPNDTGEYRCSEGIFFIYRFYIPGDQHDFPAGIGTLDFPGCQRIIEPVSHLFFINPDTLKVKGCCKVNRYTQNLQHLQGINFK